MSQYSKAGFASAYNNTGGPFSNTVSGGITGLTLQQFSQDISDTFLTYDTVFNTDIIRFEQQEWFSISDGSNWTNTSSGAGATFTNSNYGIDSTERAQGVVTCQTGTTAAGISTTYRGNNTYGVLFGIGHFFKLRMRNALPILSTAGVQAYTAYIGFGDTFGTGDMANGCYFKYTDSVNGGKWQCVTAKASVRTANDSGILADTLYSIFEIQVNAAGTSVAFYINGVNVQTITTNIPALQIWPLMKIEKSVGITSRELVSDWYDYTISRTAAR
jgi:hypothetical protein